VTRLTENVIEFQYDCDAAKADSSEKRHHAVLLKVLAEELGCEVSDIKVGQFWRLDY
jgi:hypothetical protein